MDTITQAEAKARKLKGLIFVFGQALLDDMDSGVYADCLEAIEDMADDLYTSLRNMRLDAQLRNIPK